MTTLAEASEALLVSQTYENCPPAIAAAVVTAAGTGTDTGTGTDSSCCMGGHGIGGMDESAAARVLM